MRVDVGVNDESHGGFSGCGDRGSDSGEDKRTGFRVRDRVVHSRVCDAHVFCGEQVQTYSFVHRQADCVRVGEYFIYRRDPENDRYSVYMPIFIRYLQRCRLQCHGIPGGDGGKDNSYSAQYAHTHGSYRSGGDHS